VFTLDWVSILLNAVSLSVGVASGSIISYFLLRREMSGLAKKLIDSELYVRLNTVLKEANDVLGSEDAKKFFSRLTEVMETLVKSNKNVEELIILPKRDEVSTQ